MEKSFCDLFDDNFLQQFILGPTYNEGNKLDLLLCNCPEIIVNVDSSTPEQSKFPTDHYIVEFQIKLNFKRARKVNRKVFNYKLANFEGLQNCLANVQFENASSYDIDECWLKWKDLFLKAVYNFIPVKSIKDIFFNSYFTSVFAPSQYTFGIDTNLDSFDSNTQISDITFTLLI